MSSPPIAPQLQQIVADLKTSTIFADLTDEDLVWLAERMEEKRLNPGDVVAKEGDPLEHLIVMPEGEMHVERPDEPGMPMFIARAPKVTGLLPFSRLTKYLGTARIVRPTRSLLLHKDYFPEMLHRMPLLGQRLVGLMSDRIREATREETQQDKLMALGKLSAGLAHELNNPATAARRAALNLTEAMEDVRTASLKFLEHPLSQTQREAILMLEKKSTEKAASRVGPPEDPLELSDREEQITAWLERHGVEEEWKIAPILSEAGGTTEKLDELKELLGTALVGPGLKRVAAVITIFGLIREIDNSTRRISDLVTAIKRYSYMDQSPIQEVDLKEDLENTLKIFAHRLKVGVTVS